VRFSKLNIALVALTLALVPALSACGHKEDVVTTAKTEGPYIDLGPLQYQVQISRQLNPALVEDGPYLQGISPADAKLKPTETWFGVFVRVTNDTGKYQPAANDFSIDDTQHHVFKPIALPASNGFAYEGGVLPPKSQLPPIDSAASVTSINGQLLLFKLNLDSLANRPLELHFTGAGQSDEARIDLDV
jgi:hypothetical protein